MSCEDIVGVGGDTLGVFTSAAQLAAVAGPAWLCRISPVQPGAARQQPRGDRRAAHSLIWLKNVQKVCPFAYAPIERHPTLLLTCRLFPRVPYALLEVCRMLFFSCNYPGISLIGVSVQGVIFV